MDNFASEFTPELNKSYLDSLMADIDDRGRVDEGRAHAEAESRGLGGQAYEGSAVGAARAGTARNKSSLIGSFALDVANKKRDERLGVANRGYAVEDRDFAAVEAAKNRSFQAQMAQLGYQYGDASARRDMVYGQQGALMGALTGGATSLGSSAILASDRRLKKNINIVGKRGPLTEYEFEYRDDMGLDLPTGVQRGHMADEVEIVFPAAVGMANGFKTVDYGYLAGVLR